MSLLVSHLKRIESASILLLMLSGCAEELQLEAPPEVVRAVWNPATGELPTPSNLATNAAGALALPTDGDLSAAEIEFRQYLNFLGAYPLQSTIKIPLSGPVLPHTVAPALVFSDVTRGEIANLTVEFDTETNTILASPVPHPDSIGAGLEPGHEYVYGLAGYDFGPRGPLNEDVIADAAFFFARTENSLLDHVAAMPGANTAEKTEVATQLEEVRLKYNSVFDQMAQRGFSRDLVAVAGSFKTTDAPSVWFDPDAALLPIPNELLKDEGRVNVPINDEDDEDTRALKAQYNRHTGFSASGAIVVEATDAVDSGTVNANTVRLLRLDGDQVVEVADLERGVLDDARKIWVKPRLTLEDGALHVLIVTRDVSAGGRPLEAQPLAALLRSKAPLLVNGEAQVGVLDDESAAELEPVRSRMAPVLDWLEAQGVSRSSLAAAVPFETVNGLEYLMGLRARVYEENVSTELRNVVNQSPSDRGLGLLLRDVETVVTGEITVLELLDPATRAFRPDMRGEPNSVSFVLTIPESARPGEPVPVVYFGHGLFTSRELVYMIANTLAEAGWATFSIDFPYHGRRTVCTSDVDCVDGGRCDELGQCILPDGSKGGLATVSSPWPDGPEWPAVTGAVFVDVDNIASTPDHFAQAVMDLSHGLRVIRQANWSAASGGYVLDGSDVMYLGMSLGGIIGSIFSAVEPTITSFALNVPGANFFQLLVNSASFETAFEHVLEERDIELGSDEYFRFETGLRWLLDPVDPLNIAHHATIAPFEYTDPLTGETRTSPIKRVMIQQAEDDIVVPNAATRSLSERMEVPIRNYTPSISNHAFLFDPTSFEGRRARQDVVEFFDQRNQ